jgi:hypothetical protein
MTRRRLVLAAALAAIALGAAWWLLSDGLDAEERRLVGTWRTDADGGGGADYWRFAPDRRSSWWHQAPNGNSRGTVPLAGPWSVAGREIVMDGEPSGLRRTLRPFLNRLGVATGTVMTLTLEGVADDYPIVRGLDGKRHVWDRVPD